LISGLKDSEIVAEKSFEVLIVDRIYCQFKLNYQNASFSTIVSLFTLVVPGSA